MIAEYVLCMGFLSNIFNPPGAPWSRLETSGNPKLLAGGMEEDSQRSKVPLHLTPLMRRGVHFKMDFFLLSPFGLIKHAHEARR